jgi:hypothetical protein
MFQSKTKKQEEADRKAGIPAPPASSWFHYEIPESVIKEICGIPEDQKILTIDRNYDNYPSFTIGAVIRREDA